jgi:hypothetical protein
MDFEDNCVFLDTLSLKSNVNRASTWILKAGKIQKQKDNSLMVLCTNTTKEIIDIVVTRSYSCTGKNQGAQGSFHQYLSRVMNELDKKGMRGFYICICHWPNEMGRSSEKLITDRGYKCSYLPPFSPSLNPIESLFNTVRHYVKSDPFITEARLLEMINSASERFTADELTACFRQSLMYLNDV